MEELFSLAGRALVAAAIGRGLKQCDWSINTAATAEHCLHFCEGHQLSLGRMGKLGVIPSKPLIMLVVSPACQNSKSDRPVGLSRQISEVLILSNGI